AALDPIFATASVLAAAGAALPASSTEAALDYIERRRLADGFWAWRGYPPDADDTALCLALLIRDGAARAEDAAILRDFWRDRGGPFRTWPPWYGNDRIPDDPIVNCNVLYCLGAAGSDRERRAVSDLVLRSIGAARFSLYYKSRSTQLYAAARAGLEDR